MREILTTLLYSVLFFVLSVIAAVLMFLFVLPFSMLLLAGLVTWGVVEAIRIVKPVSAASVERAVTGTVKPVVRHRPLELRSQLAGPAWQQVYGEHRLQFMPHWRKSRMIHRMVVVGVRRPHHARVHSS